MLAHPTLDQLHTLGLHGLAKGFKELEHKPEARALEHAEWLGLLLEYELTLRRQKQFETRARAAKLRRVRLDRRAPQSARHRGVRPRQELARLRARPQGLSREHIRSLHPRSPAVRRPGHSARRRALRQAAAIPRPRQTAHPR
jgi:hypothetical protein